MKNNTVSTNHVAEAGEGVAVDQGVVTSRAGSIEDVAEAFVAAMDRHWEREPGS